MTVDHRYEGHVAANQQKRDLAIYHFEIMEDLVNTAIALTPPALRTLEINNLINISPPFDTKKVHPDAMGGVYAILEEIIFNEESAHVKRVRDLIGYNDIVSTFKMGFLYQLFKKIYYNKSEAVARSLIQIVRDMPMKFYFGLIPPPGNITTCKNMWYNSNILITSTIEPEEPAKILSIDQALSLLGMSLSEKQGGKKSKFKSFPSKKSSYYKPNQRSANRKPQHHPLSLESETSKRVHLPMIPAQVIPFTIPVENTIVGTTSPLSPAPVPQLLSTPSISPSFSRLTGASLKEDIAPMPEDMPSNHPHLTLITCLMPPSLSIPIKTTLSPIINSNNSTVSTSSNLASTATKLSPLPSHTKDDTYIPPKAERGNFTPTFRSISKQPLVHPKIVAATSSKIDGQPVKKGKKQPIQPSKIVGKTDLKSPLLPHTPNDLHTFVLPRGLRAFHVTIFQRAHPIVGFPKYQNTIDQIFDIGQQCSVPYKDFKTCWVANEGGIVERGSHSDLQYPEGVNLFGIYIPHGGETTYGKVYIKYIQTALLFRGLRPTEWEANN